MGYRVASPKILLFFLCLVLSGYGVNGQVSENDGCEAFPSAVFSGKHTSACVNYINQIAFIYDFEKSIDVWACCGSSYKLCAPNGVYTGYSTKEEAEAACMASDPCANSDCGHGQCRVQGRGMYCVCDAGYEGSSCDRPVPRDSEPSPSPSWNQPSQAPSWNQPSQAPSSHLPSQAPSSTLPSQAPKSIDSTTRRTCFFPLFSLPETGTDERCDHVACPKRTEAACLVQHRTFGETCEVHCANGNAGVETWKCADSDAGPSFTHAFTWERIGPALDCGLTDASDNNSNDNSNNNSNQPQSNPTDCSQETLQEAQKWRALVESLSESLGHLGRRNLKNVNDVFEVLLDTMHTGEILNVKY